MPRDFEYGLTNNEFIVIAVVVVLLDAREKSPPLLLRVTPKVCSSLPVPIVAKEEEEEHEEDDEAVATTPLDRSKMDFFPAKKLLWLLLFAMSMRSLLVKERSARRHAFRSDTFMCGVRVSVSAVLCVVYTSVRVCCDAPRGFEKKNTKKMSTRQARSLRHLRRSRLAIYVTLYNLHNSTRARAIHNN